MFLGSFNYKIDDRGRLKMPSAFASSLGNDFTITRSLDDYLWVMPQQEWMVLAARLTKDERADPDLAELQRWFFGSAEITSLDSAGRMAIPDPLLAWADIKHEVRLVGVGSRIELWAMERWQAHDAAIKHAKLRKDAVIYKI